MSSQVLDVSNNDLPYWMRQAQHGWDWGLVLVAVFSLLAAWPFINSPDLPRTNAAENYIFMTANYSDALREGRLYPRWSPNTFNGFGAPIPNYFPPGAPYSAALIKVLFTNDPVLAVRAVFILAHLIAGTSLYAFVRRYLTANAGLLAAVLFLYSPYFGNVAPFIRGDLAEYLALALTPLLLLTIDRLTSNNRPIDLFIAALVVAATLLTHPWIALAGMLIALLYTFPRPGLQTFIAMILGVSLSAFFWMPALLEQNLVQWVDRTTIQTLTLPGLFALFKTVDLGQLLPDLQLTLGQTLIAFILLAAVVMLIFTRSYIRFYLRFMVIGGILVVVAILYLPHEIWLLGLISLCASIASSTIMGAQMRLPISAQRIYPAAVLIVALILSLPVLLVPRWPTTFSGVRPIDQIRYEQQGAGIAALPPHWPLPITPTASLLPNRFLLSGYQSGNISKIVPAQVGSRTQISVLRYESHRERYQIISDGRVDLDLLTTYFPGWKATITDQAINIRPNEQTGLMQIQMPAGNSELVITFGPTPTRQTAWLVTWTTLVILLLVTRWRLRLTPEPPPDFDLLSAVEARLMSVVLVALALITTLLANPASPVTLHNRPGHALQEAIPLRNRTSVGLEALAYSLALSRFQAGETLNFIVHWQAIRALPANYQTRTYLIESDSSTRWHRTPLQTPGAYPTSRWRTYQYVSDHFTIPLSSTIIPGQYQIAIEVLGCNMDCNDSKRLNFFNAEGASVGPTLILPTTIRIEQ